MSEQAIRTTLNRYTTNHIAWMGALKELCAQRKDEKLIPFIKEIVFDAKSALPQDVQEQSGLSKYNTLQEMTDMNDYDFGKICLYLADTSIYDTGVYKQENIFIYKSKVDNTKLFYPLLLADYLVNVKEFKDTMPAETVLKIRIELTGRTETDKDAFAYLMNTAFKDYFGDIEVDVLPENRDKKE